MLGKLLKHEWKAVWKVPTLLIGIVMLAGLIAGLTFAMPIWDSDWVGLPMSGDMLIMTFFFGLSGVNIGIIIYFGVRYYRSMFTDEGYLTHTLPVSARELLLNKVITMSAWNLITMAGVIVSLMIFGGVAFLSLAPLDGAFAREVTRALAELPEIFSSSEMAGFQAFCASQILMLLTSAFSGTMILIGAITLGQMVRKHRILGAIGAYFAINGVVQMVNTVVMMPIMFNSMNNMWWEMDSPFPIFTGFYTVMSLVFVAVSIGLYFLCEYLLKRQLELE